LGVVSDAAAAPAPPPDATIGDLLRRAADQAPDRTALIWGEADVARRRRWTYVELLACAEAVACWLPRV
jgi:fatty-acyl-CoA synthase